MILGRLRGGKSSLDPPRSGTQLLGFGLVQEALKQAATRIGIARSLITQLEAIEGLAFAYLICKSHCFWNERDPFEDSLPLPSGRQRELLEICQGCGETGRLLPLADLPQDMQALRELLRSREVRSLCLLGLKAMDGEQAAWLVVGLKEGAKGPEWQELIESAARELDHALGVAALTERWRASERRAGELEEELEALLLKQQRDEALKERARERADWKIQEAERVKNEFLSSVSHELRTPLNAIQGYTRMVLREENLTERQRLSLDRVLTSSNNQLKLINNILEYSRLEAGRMRLDLQYLELAPMLNDCIGQLGALAEEKGLELKLNLSDNLPQTTVSDHAKLERVLVNLLGNAIKFTQQGSVTLKAEMIAGLLRFQVVDTGMGIDASDLERIFDRFQRGSQVEHGAAPQAGTGLGLAISRRITELLGGRIQVQSELGKGSTFSLELPHIIDLETARQGLNLEEDL